MATKINILDVLIVYSAKIAKSADASSNGPTPFPHGSSNESYNIVYGYFLTTCLKHKLKCGFTTSSDIIGPGKCKSYWLVENNCWIKVNREGYSKLIFDKFSPVNKRLKNYRNLLFSSDKVKPFNSPFLFNLFFDKYKTYQKLLKYCIPAVAIDGHSQINIFKGIKKLNQITAKSLTNADFASEIVMKDRFGAGGNNVYKFKNTDVDGMAKTAQKTSKSYIIQPLIKFDKGFKYNNIFARTDIRLIFLGGKIIQTYIRIAKQGDFRCNEHAGGTLIYLSKKDMPKKLVSYSEEIATVLGNNRSLFSLDFIISNSQNIYFLEGNTGPGLDWNMALKINEIEAKKLIDTIVLELVKRVATKNIHSTVIPQTPAVPTTPVFA